MDSGIELSFPVDADAFSSPVPILVVLPSSGIAGGCKSIASAKLFKLQFHICFNIIDNRYRKNKTRHFVLI